MELKFAKIPLWSYFHILLIAPYGIEIGFISNITAYNTNLLIAPYGIEMKMDCQSRIIWTTTNRTLWN